MGRNLGPLSRIRRSLRRGVQGLQDFTPQLVVEVGGTRLRV